ncbi:MAG: NADH-quinone oxidoreductase subunit NuoI [Firmicutes bacterium]|nr:NADH-quinone oxidoreductase subunit NuoI [Bacillota bacterium]
MPSPLEDVKALFTGLATTMKFFVRRPETVEYPEVKRAIPVGARGRHQLRRHEDGLERCIGCELCAAACPAAAIRVVAAENDPEHPVSPGERYAAVYEIDLLRCIFCGMCEEACPTNAIVLSQNLEMADYSREALYVDKRDLLAPLPESARAATGGTT